MIHSIFYFAIALFVFAQTVDAVDCGVVSPWSAQCNAQTMTETICSSDRTHVADSVYSTVDCTTASFMSRTIYPVGTVAPSCRTCPSSINVTYVTSSLIPYYAKMETSADVTASIIELTTASATTCFKTPDNIYGKIKCSDDGSSATYYKYSSAGCTDASLTYNNTFGSGMIDSQTKLRFTCINQQLSSANSSFQSNTHFILVFGLLLTFLSFQFQ